MPEPDDFMTVAEVAQLPASTATAGAGSRPRKYLVGAYAREWLDGQGLGKPAKLAAAVAPRQKRLKAHVAETGPNVIWCACDAPPRI